MIKIISNNSNLLRIFKPFQIMFNDGIFVCTKNGIKCTVVNPSHTAMVEIEVDKKFFKQYKVDKDEDSFGIEISEFIKLLEKKSFRKMAHETILYLKDERSDKGVFKVNGNKMKYTKNIRLVDPDIMSKPKFPKMDLKHSYEIQDYELIKMIIDDIKTEKSHLKIRTMGDIETLEIISYDYGESDSIYELDKSEVVKLSATDGFISIYEAVEFWYIIWGIGKAFNKPKITIELDTDYPVVIRAEDKHLRIKYALAPRIESE